MNQSGGSAREPIIVDAANVALIEDAARDLEEFSGKIMTPGHWPSWSYPQVSDGLALCLGCWRPITAPQLGVEPCPGARRGSGWRSTSSEPLRSGRRYPTETSHLPTEPTRC
jgi:hypothetical protein